MPNNATKELTQERSNTDWAHTKVDPYQDPAYNVSRQSPNYARGTAGAVGQNIPSIGRGDSMTTLLSNPTGNPAIDEDTDLDDDWD